MKFAWIAVATATAIRLYAGAQFWTAGAVAVRDPGGLSRTGAQLPTVGVGLGRGGRQTVLLLTV